MKRSLSLGISVIALVLLAALVVLPVSGMVVPVNSVPTTSSAATGVTATPTVTVTKLDLAATGVPASKPFISATVSSATPAVGDPVTIGGLATGGNLDSGVQIWVFAGNYVNVTTVPVKADGTYSKTYSTKGLPPATFYVFAQSPGSNGIFNIDLYDAGIYSGQVVNTRTKSTIFNFTGTGSVQDAAAATALSDALNQPTQDDIYTKLTFQLTATVPTPAAAATAEAATTTASAAAPTTKSPLPLEVTAGALLISGCFAAFCMRKTH